MALPSTLYVVFWTSVGDTFTQEWPPITTKDELVEALYEQSARMSSGCFEAGLHSVQIIQIDSDAPPRDITREFISQQIRNWRADDIWEPHFSQIEPEPQSDEQE